MCLRQTRVSQAFLKQVVYSWICPRLCARAAFGHSASHAKYGPEPLGVGLVHGGFGICAARWGTTLGDPRVSKEMGLYHGLKSRVWKFLKKFPSIQSLIS